MKHNYDLKLLSNITQITSMMAKRIRFLLHKNALAEAHELLKVMSNFTLIQTRVYNKTDYQNLKFFQSLINDLPYPELSELKQVIDSAITKIETHESTFFLLNSPDLDYWGYRIICESEPEKNIVDALQFLLDATKTQHVYKKQSIDGELDKINITFYPILLPNRLPCILENRWHELLEEDFEDFHVIVNQQNPIAVLSTYHKSIGIDDVFNIIHQNGGK